MILYLQTGLAADHRLLPVYVLTSQAALLAGRGRWTGISGIVRKRKGWACLCRPDSPAMVSVLQKLRKMRADSASHLLRHPINFELFLFLYLVCALLLQKINIYKQVGGGRYLESTSSYVRLYSKTIRGIIPKSAYPQSYIQFIYIHVYTVIQTVQRTCHTHTPHTNLPAEFPPG